MQSSIRYGFSEPDRNNTESDTPIAMFSEDELMRRKSIKPITYVWSNDYQRLKATTAIISETAGTWDSYSELFPQATVVGDYSCVFPGISVPPDLTSQNALDAYAENHLLMCNVRSQANPTQNRIVLLNLHSMNYPDLRLRVKPLSKEQKQILRDLEQSLPLGDQAALITELKRPFTF